MLSGKRAVSGRGPTFECVCKPDLVVPGKNIMACSPGAGNLYSMKSGTSMSTPLVSGTIALALEKDPLLTNLEIKMMLRESTEDMGLPRNQQGWGNVMYIPAAPMCEKNLAYAQKVKIALEKGASPGDFPREDYEASWQGRFTLEDLNIHGKRALGMPV